jgi:Holliday junction DNA helicase RuvA
MFSYLNGTVAELEPNAVVIDVGGVGFACNASINTIARLQVGGIAKICTHLNVREDALELFGFYDKEELMTFKLLTAISGVGPKVALSILSAVSPAELAVAVTTGDDKPILAASGVGKKLAGRIILELKDKIAKSSIDVSEISRNTYVPQASGADKEAAEALSALGYGRDEIGAALRGVETSGMSVEDIIKLALARLMR